MIRARRHIALLALAYALAGPALAQTQQPADFFDAYVEDRARIFSEVCMASAPGFETLEERALAVGFEAVEGRLMFAEVIVSLKPNDDGSRCACQMSMFAPEFPLLLVTMVDRLRADYPVFRHDDSLPGYGYSAIFEREGEEVVLELNPEKFKEYDMLVGWVFAQRSCPS